MSNDMLKYRVARALDAELESVRTTPRERDRLYENAIGGRKVKRKLRTGIVLAMILVMMVAVAVAAVLLTRPEIVEKVAVPMAIENDRTAGVQGSYTPEQLAELIRTLNENGFTMEENNSLMQALQNGQGYYEEEAIMEICRQAFGGNFYTWTLEEQNWFEHLMVEIGWYESYESHLPGPDNMKYEEAEAYAFETLKKKYGKDLHPEDRTLYTLSRQFYLDYENGGRATWSFTLDPRDIDHGMYNIRFADRNPEDTVSFWAEIPDWTQPYTGDQLMSQFHSVYTWFQGKWPQEAWRRLHEMMQKAELEPAGMNYAEYRGYLLTGYPEPAAQDLSREEAVRNAKEALGKDRAAMDSAVLTEYEGKRIWMVGLVIHAPEDGSKDEDAGHYAVAVDSTSGKTLSVRRQTTDDNPSMFFVPEAAYEKAREGILRESDFIRIAAEAIREKYPELNPMDENEFEIRHLGGGKQHSIRFLTKSIRHGNASAEVGADGSVREIQADMTPATGDNLFSRYGAIYGYYGDWDQSVWVRLSKDMEQLEPEETAGKLLRMGNYPAEETVPIDHEKARELAIRASGKRTAEINTCVLIGAEPNPVWKLRVIADDPVDQVIELDAVTGEVLATDIFKTDYTPGYVLYSLERNWRRLELETEGAVQMAIRAITYRFGDLWLDFPELDVSNPDEYETRTEGLTVCFDGRWKGMKSYRVEFDENGYVIRCEESVSESAEERPDQAAFASGFQDDIPMRQHALDGSIIPTPTPQPDGRMWFQGTVYPDEKDFWEQFEAAMTEYGVTPDNLEEKVREWMAEYGADPDSWPDACYVLAYFMTQVDEEDFDPDMHPIFPAEGKPGKEEMKQKAREAFHTIADPEMGSDWVDALEIGGFLNSDGFNFRKGESYGKPVWFLNMLAWNEETEDWEAKGYVQLDEDGNVLYAELDLYGNG